MSKSNCQDAHHLRAIGRLAHQLQKLDNLKARDQECHHKKNDTKNDRLSPLIDCVLHDLLDVNQTNR